MKELSIEEKAKRYDEALEMAKKLIENEETNVPVFYVNNIKDIFPELKESEDESIRKEITTFLRRAAGGFLDPTKHCETFSKWLAWLEKHGEQKPSEDEDREYACQSPEHYTRRELMIYNLGIADGKRMIEDAIKETEPAWKPSDEQIKVCKEVYADILSAKGFDLGTVNSELNRMEEELKKLK